jgi:hypothetical protein
MSYHNARWAILNFKIYKSTGDNFILQALLQEGLEVIKYLMMKIFKRQHWSQLCSTIMEGNQELSTSRLGVYL